MDNITPKESKRLHLSLSVKFESDRPLDASLYAEVIPKVVSPHAYHWPDNILREPARVDILGVREAQPLLTEWEQDAIRNIMESISDRLLSQLEKQK